MPLITNNDVECAILPNTHFQTRRHLKVASGLKVGIWQNRTFDVIIRDERHR